MQDKDNWLSEYGDNHREMRFAAIYWASVLILVPSAIGLLWALPVPGEFERISPLLNWGSTFLMAALVYYFIISMPLAIGMLPFVFGIAALHIWFPESTWARVELSAGFLFVSLIGIYLGNSTNGGWRAVLRDIQLMMIAPVWLLSMLYRRFGIPY